MLAEIIEDVCVWGGGWATEIGSPLYPHTPATD
uniref:Uncharacterized protein n=1 Tax=Anguilla anguilla TaxID=7936 RepID=A0A0E9V3G5_ANGAN